jgi:Pentapeptide repeats (8 copies)
MWPWKEKISPKTVIKNVLGETLLEVPARDLWGKDVKWLRGKDLSYAVLRGQWLDGADLENVILFGADLRQCSFRGCNLRHANLAYNLIDGARFDLADLDDADLIHTSGIRSASFEGSIISQDSTIPGIYASRRREF